MVRSRWFRVSDSALIRSVRAPRAPRASRYAAVLAVASALLLSACAPEPGVLTFSAVPPTAEEGPVDQSTESGAARELPSPEVKVEDGSAVDAGTDTEAGSAADLVPSAPRATDSIVAPVSTASVAKSLLGERIRNTHARLSARFSYVPGVPKFTKIVDREIRAAIRLSDRRFVPQAFPVGSGLRERGCVAGSSRWTAKQVMRRSATAPPSKRGTVVVCDVIAASGTVIQIAMRTVKGSSTRITRDRTRVFYADLKTRAAGEVIRAGLWRNMAPEALWRRAVTQLIEGAGGTVATPLAEPSASQLKLARSALRKARTTAKQGVVVTIPAGLDSPELAAAGLAPTVEPTVVRVPRATADVWSRELGDLLRHSSGKPFVGVKAKASTVDLDCRLLTCVALTYDDGPSPYTSRLLTTMRAERARITLFMIGPNAQARPGAVRRALADGQEIGSHTMHHPDLTMLSLGDANAEVRDAAAILKRIGHHRVTLFRPPYGAITQRIIDRAGMPAILWNVDTNDWREPGRGALIQRSVPVVQPGGIILFHDTHEDSVAVAGKVVRGLRDRGFELVTVSQLFGGRVPVARISGRY